MALRRYSITGVHLTDIMFAWEGARILVSTSFDVIPLFPSVDKLTVSCMFRCCFLFVEY